MCIIDIIRKFTLFLFKGYLWGGGVFMEFNGLTSANFDFFKKKDKMLREEYEKNKNELKLSFRSLCYEIQKIYHKSTNGVFEINKEFQNFNKKSSYITAQHCDEGTLGISLQLNSENITIHCCALCNDESETDAIENVINTKRDIVREYIMGNKYAVINADFPLKNKKPNNMKISSINANNKNYDSLLEYIKNNKEQGRFNLNVSIGCIYPKGECIKQGKKFALTAYDSIMDIMELRDKLKIS